MLDLGAWMTMQSKVEIYHRCNVKQYVVLSQSIKKAWHAVEEHKLTKIWELFLKVLDIIIQDQGGDYLVESNLGLMCVPE